MSAAAVAPWDPPRPKGSSAAKAWARALELTARLTADPRRTLAVVLDSLGERYGEAPAILSAGETLSFAGLAALSRRYTGWAEGRGLGAGDVVALLAPTQPSYFAIWTGISRTGATVALINTHLQGE